MKVAYMIYKDVIVFLRDYKSFVLLFLTPILLTSSIGIVYINSQPTDVPVIVCSESQKETLYFSLIQYMEESGIFSVDETEGNCMEKIESGIKSSEYRLGILVRPYVFTMNPDERQPNIEVVYDNAKPINFFIQSHISLVTHQLSNELISSAVGMAHDEIERTIEEIDSITFIVKGFTNRLDDVRDQLLETRSDVRNAIDMTKDIHNSAFILNESLNELDLVLAGLQNIENGVTDAESRIIVIASLLSSLNESTDDVDAALAILSSIKGNVSEVRDGVEYARNGTQAFVSDLNTQDILESLDSVEDTLTDIIEEIDTVIDEIDDSVSEAENLRIYLKSRLGDVPQQYEEPIRTEMQGYFGNRNFVNFLFPSIIITVLMWVSVFLSSVAFIKQRNQGILRRISVSPTGTATIIFSKVIVYTIISLIFLPLLIVLGIMAFGVDISFLSILPIVVIYSLSSMMFVLFGMVIASFSNSENTAILASLILVIPFMFLSGTFFPWESLPEGIKTATIFMPTNISVNLINGFFFYELAAEYLFYMLGLLLTYLGLMAVVAWAALSRTVKK